MTVAQRSQPSVHLRKSGLTAKLWPNGQISLYQPRVYLSDAPENPALELEDDILTCVGRAYQGQERLDALDSLGLSNVTISDKSLHVSRSGLRGMTSLGKTRVRNAAWMLQQEAGKHKLTFATVTLPNLATEELASCHVHWHKIIERYRLEMRRTLQSAGLSGEIVGVTEVQEKRYEKDGYPILHAHFLFVGFSNSGGWAVSPRRHDFIWRKCVLSVLPGLCGPVPSFESACNLQSVKKDPGAYLAKYMSKGGAVIGKIVAEGLECWLPKQWWNCSKSIVRRMESQIKVFREGAPWLLARAEDGDKGIFEYYCEVPVVMASGVTVVMAGVGRLTKRANKQVRKFLFA